MSIEYNVDWADKTDILILRSGKLEYYSSKENVFLFAIGS